MQTVIRHPIPDHPSDVELAARIAAHDQDAFVILMRRHNQRLFRTARSILHNDAEAEDAVQESYLQAYRSINTFRGDAKLSTWLTRIVVNQSLARIRRAGRRAQITSLYADEENNHDVSEAEMKPSTAESPEGSAMRAQARAMLESCIDALPEQFRTVFVMRAVEEMSGEEVALCLDIPEATVRSRFFRARSQLRSALLDHVDSAFGDVFSFDGARCDRIVATVLDRLNIAPSDAL